MNTEQLFESMQGIDEDILERSESRTLAKASENPKYGESRTLARASENPAHVEGVTREGSAKSGPVRGRKRIAGAARAWKSWGAAAAVCFLVAAAGAVFAPGRGDTPTPPVGTADDPQSVFETETGENPGGNGDAEDDRDKENSGDGNPWGSQSGENDGHGESSGEPVDGPDEETSVDVEGGGEHAEGPAYEWTVNYNVAEAVSSADAACPADYFAESLSDEEIAAVEPGMRIEWMDYSGDALFDGEGTLRQLWLYVTTTIPDSAVIVTISEHEIPRCYVLPVDPVPSQCLGGVRVDYLVSQYNSGGRIHLEAESRIDGVNYRFEMGAPVGQEEQAKEDFQWVLECFTWYSAEHNMPDLTAVKADVIPVRRNNLTVDEARSDPDFGEYLPTEVPEGFIPENFEGYKAQDSDRLSGVWARGMEYIRWQVRKPEERDELLFTSVEDKENYDLSLYPIPRAESVPEELREIVDNPVFAIGELTLETVYARAYRVEEAGDIDGWRINFSVRFGDVVVEIKTKGVEPEWVYEQLKALQEN